MRFLAHARRYSLTVIVTLALALGANTALFSVANAFLLRPLPYERPERLAVVYATQPVTRARAAVSAPDLISWTVAVSPVMQLAAFRPWGFVLGGAGDAERLAGARVTANLFPLLGVAPRIGRGFQPDEDVFGAPHVAIVSDRIWQERLDSAGDLTGRAITLDGTRYSVVGVMPPDFRLPAADVWTPLAFEPFALAQRGTRPLTVLARLGDGMSIARATETLGSVSAELSRRFPDSNRDWGVDVVPLGDYVRGTLRPTVILLWGAVALVLLIACGNTASLMLAREAGRRRQIAIRHAIGASRARIVRDLLAESVTLASIAGVLAIPIGLALLSLLVRVAPPELSRLAGVQIDGTVVVFTAGAAVLTGLLFGVVPALKMSRADLTPLLRSAAALDAGHGALRHVAVACQLAVAVVVLVGAGLLARSLERVQQIDPGFDPSHVLTMSLSSQRPQFFEDVLRQVRPIAGVTEAGLNSHLPLAGSPLIVGVEDVSRPMSRASENVLANCSAVAGDWTRALRIPVVRGRVFTSIDSAAGAPAVIISASLARRLWGSANPLGRRIQIGGGIGANPAPREVVGMAGDVRTSLEAPPAFQVYIPYAQAGWPTMSLVARTTADPARWTREVRAVILSVDRDQAIYNVRSFDQILARTTAARRFQAIVVRVFAACAVLLAIAGVYGVIGFTVQQRAPELGVRIALGASRRRVLAVVARGTLRWGVVGVLVGLLVAMASGPLLASMLYGVEPTDPATLLAAGGAMLAVLLIVAAAAARRAGTIDPLVCIRGE